MTQEMQISLACGGTSDNPHSDCILMLRHKIAIKKISTAGELELPASVAAGLATAIKIKLQEGILMNKSTVSLLALFAILPLTAAPHAEARGVAQTNMPISTGIPITASSPTISGPGTMTSPSAIFSTSPFGFNTAWGGLGYYGGYGGYYGGYGDYDNLQTPLQGFGLNGSAISTQIPGPMQVLNTGSHSVPQAIATREIFTNGFPTTVSEPLVTEYHWPSGLASKSGKQYARVYPSGSQENQWY